MTVSDVFPVESDPAVDDVPVVASVPAFAGVFVVTAWSPCYCGLPYFLRASILLLASEVLSTSLMLLASQLFSFLLLLALCPCIKKNRNFS
jgi:hypothetical protein